MKTITIYEEKNLPLNLEQLINGLNEICKNIKFRKGNISIKFPKSLLKQPDSYRNLPKALSKGTKNDLLVMIYTWKQYHNNYFFESSGNQVIVSLFGWEYLTNLSINNGALFFIADMLLLGIDNSYRHKETTGCLYDFRWDKTGIDKAMRLSYICPTCLTRLSNKKLSKKNNLIMRDVQTILNDLGSASKWNKDVIEYWSERKKANPGNNEKQSQVLSSQDFIPEDGDTSQIDLSRPTIKQLCQSYLELTDSQLADNKKGKAFEDFTNNFFGIIKGWRLVKRNINLGDCEIDLIYNITKGPKEIQGKLGDRIYIECKNRLKSSDSRDISHFILNLKTRNLTGGIFFSLSGITGYSPDNFQNVDAAYKRIIDVCRQEKIFVIPLVRKDIEAVRNGKNIVSLLEDHIDHFYMI